MEGHYGLSDTLELISSLSQLIDLDLSLPLIQGANTPSYRHSHLEERLLDMEIPSKRFNNLTKKEREALYSLKDDPSIIIKGADRGRVVVVWDREDYLKDAMQTA